MADKKNKWLIIGLIIGIIEILGLILYKFFPQLKKYCEEMKENCTCDSGICKPKKK